MAAWRRTAEQSSQRPGTARRRASDEGNLAHDHRALRPLSSFILPGGGAAGAALHVARTVCRRAERTAVTAARSVSLNPEALKYLNRLSDYLFVMGRAVNDNGATDILWVPGASR